MENYIELKVGDVYRENRARKLNKIVNQFTYNGIEYFTCTDLESDKTGYPQFFTVKKNFLCTTREVYTNGNSYDGVIEVNGMVVRGKGGKVLVTQHKVKEKESKPVQNTQLTDFQKFYKLQKSGKINMNDITNGCILTGLSKDKYIDIMCNYYDYVNGIRK